ncbi:MAG: 1-acyl-sn-glycerol-3-phosphate acyltransferase [Acidimicrobiales bacterium]|nr:1-acyl-sn-glycerol-3-phosphate acyltransferase [Acidimicrobiales bacterium]
MRFRPTYADPGALRDWAYEVGDRRTSLVLYWVVRRLARLLLHPYLRVAVRNAEALDRPGPLVVAPVHRSHLDSVIVATVCQRRLRALGKESLFARRGLRYLCSALGAIPVKRGTADREALKAAKQLLDRGEALFVFPEGARISAAAAKKEPGSARAAINTVQPLFDGAAWLAARTHAPVVPVGIAGTAAALSAGSRRLHRTTVRIVVGNPIDPPQGTNGARASRHQLAEFTEALAIRLQELQDEAVRWAEEHPHEYR